MWWQTKAFNLSTLEAEVADLCEFETNLVYTEKPFLEKPKKQNKKTIPVLYLLAP